MVLSQIELRSSSAPAPVSAPKVKGTTQSKTVERYVEGESGDEEDEGDGVEEVAFEDVVELC